MSDFMEEESLRLFCGLYSVNDTIFLPCSFKQLISTFPQIKKQITIPTKIAKKNFIKNLQIKLLGPSYKLHY